MATTAVARAHGRRGPSAPRRRPAPAAIARARDALEDPRAAGEQPLPQAEGEPRRMHVAPRAGSTRRRGTRASRSARAPARPSARPPSRRRSPRPSAPSCAGAVETTSSPPRRYRASTPSASHHAPIASTVSRAARTHASPARAVVGAQRRPRRGPCGRRSRRCARSARARSGRPRARPRARRARPRAGATPSTCRCSRRRRPRRRRRARPRAAGAPRGLPASAIQNPCASCSITAPPSRARHRGRDRRALDVAQRGRHVDADRVHGEARLAARRAPRGSRGCRAAGA